MRFIGRTELLSTIDRTRLLYVPASYTRTAAQDTAEVEQAGSHFKGIDDAIAAKGGNVYRTASDNIGGSSTASGVDDELRFIAGNLIRTTVADGSPDSCTIEFILSFANQMVTSGTGAATPGATTIGANELVGRLASAAIGGQSPANARTIIALGGAWNLSAAVAPKATDDTPDYEVGSVWMDTTNSKLYMCFDATSTAAVWRELSSVAIAVAVDTILLQSGGTDDVLLQDGTDRLMTQAS